MYFVLLSPRPAFLFADGYPVRLPDALCIGVPLCLHAEVMLVLVLVLVLLLSLSLLMFVHCIFWFPILTLHANGKMFRSLSAQSCPGW